MTYRIGKSYSFDASHQLHGLPAGHKCGRLHGHTYTVTVELQADLLSPPGFVVDFGDLTPLKKYLDEKLDHRHLNDVLDIEPTSEALAEHLYVWCHENMPANIAVALSSVRVSETPSSWAEYRVGA